MMPRTIQTARPLRRLLLILPVLCCGMAIGSDGAQSENIIANGDFSQGNTGFESQLIYSKPAENCLWPRGYTIASNFDHPQLHTLIQQKPFSAPNNNAGKAKVLFANTGGTEPVVMWSANVKCQPHTKYIVSFNCISLSGDEYGGNPSRQIPSLDWQPEFEIWANDVPSGPVQAGLGKYSKGGLTWDSMKATTVTIKIIRTKMLTHTGGIVGICNIQMIPAKD